MTGDRHSVGSHRRRANKVGSGLLQEARAKLARLQVKSERPGLTAGAFAFCGVRTARACMMTTIRERFEV